MDCTNKKVQLIYGDVNLGVSGMAENKKFHYIFSYTAGGLVSLVSDGIEWIYRVPQPTFWRALTDNDRGSHFHLRSGMWLAADMYVKCVDIQVAVDNEKIPMPTAPENNKYSDEEYAEKVCVTYVYETITVPVAKVYVDYTVDATGNILVDVNYKGTEGLPGLPVFGMRFVMPTAADKFVYRGLSGETYPDRMAGGAEGTYEVTGLPVTPYMVPQDCGMHMNTQWVEITRSTTLDNSNKHPGARTLRIETAGNAFSCLPYTAQELENAFHHEELPPVRRTVLGIYGAVRGVGGINSWGADPEEQYHIDAEKDISFGFKICGPHS